MSTNQAEKEVKQRRTMRSSLVESMINVADPVIARRIANDTIERWLKLGQCEMAKP